jgi:hypothetical protein
VESGEDNAAAGGLWVIMYGRSTPAPAGSPSTLDSWLAEPEPRRTGVAKQCTAGRPLLAGLGWAGAGSCGQRARGIGLFFWLKAWRGGALHQHVHVLVPRTHSQRCWFRGCGQRRQPAAEPASYLVMQLSSSYAYSSSAATAATAWVQGDRLCERGRTLAPTHRGHTAAELCAPAAHSSQLTARRP